MKKLSTTKDGKLMHKGKIVRAVSVGLPIILSAWEWPHMAKRRVDFIIEQNRGKRNANAYTLGKEFPDHFRYRAVQYYKIN